MAASERSANKKTVDPKLLELLACPLTKGPLSWDPDRGELVSRLARLAYPVRDGIPIMLPSEARTLAVEDKTPPRPGAPRPGMPR